MSLAVFLGAFAVLIVASCVQSSIGFGANLVSMPLVVQFAPDLVPGSLLLAGFAMNLLILQRDRSAINFKPVRGAIGGRFIGTGIGIVALRQLSEDQLTLVIAVGVLAMVAAAAFKGSPPRTIRNMVAAGTLSGFTASTAGIGGPPVAVLFQDAEGPEIRGSMASFFLVGTVVTLAGLAIAGRFGLSEIGWGIALMPAAAAGYFLSGPMLPIVDKGYTRPAILGLSAAAAIVLLARWKYDF